MSNQYPGGIITKNPATPTGPFNTGAAPGVWTLEQQMQFVQQGVWPTAGLTPNYIEDVFSTFLYTPVISNDPITITNGIDLAGKGGMVWFKNRSVSQNHSLVDTVRGGTNLLTPNDAFAAYTASIITAFGSTGFTTGTSTFVTKAPDNYVSWTFREQPKFFDIVTYTGNGATSQTIPHNLGSTPGCIIVKSTTDVNGWYVYHRGLTVPNNYNVYLSATVAQVNQGSNVWNVTSTTFEANQPNLDSNKSGQNYVAYIFAHDAGGFGLTGTDNVISCGSFTTDGTGAAGNITLGYEAQWIFLKRIDAAGSWNIIDIMRGSSLTAYNYLQPNASTSESSSASAGQGIFPTATGFFVGNNFPPPSATFIYIAIRRGPMKVPTLGTSVYMGATRTGNGAVTALTAAGFPPDLYWAKSIAAVRDHAIFDRLRGPLPLLSSNNTQNEIAYADDLKSFDMTGVTTGTDGSTNAYNQNGVAYVNWYMRRAPSFFDEVCYTGTGANATVTHNLGVAPELLIVRNRSSGGTDWVVWSKSGTQLNSYSIALNSSNAYGNSGDASWGTVGGTPNMNSSSFSLGDAFNVNFSGATYVAYLFATCAGVSKVGSYTGTGTTLQIDCGFTAGARFVLIKRTNSTGDWYVWDTARGIVSGNDPYLLLNNDVAEVTSTDYIDTANAGFEISSTAPAAINASAGTFIFLAIA